MSEKCLVCESSLAMLARDGRADGGWNIHCPRCGMFHLTGSAEVELPPKLGEDGRRWAKLSHAIRLAQNETTPPDLAPDAFDAIWKMPLPKPPAQADSYIRFLGSAGIPVGEYSRMTTPALAALLGTEDKAEGVSPGVEFILSQLLERNLIETDPMDEGLEQYRLTMRGWERYGILSTTAVDTRIAFMAMAYGKPETEATFRDCFIHAASEAGFDLQRLDTFPKAGHIDWRMRAEIRTAKFIVADLTDENSGAYWESGFAEGLGKPVFYTCETSKFEKMKTHFDTEHLFTIKWSKDDLPAAKSELKAAIRNTFPLEAKMRDDKSTA